MEFDEMLYYDKSNLEESYQEGLIPEEEYQEELSEIEELETSYYCYDDY